MCTKGGRERRGKNKNFFLQKQIQFQILNITLILAGSLLLFCFVYMSRSTIKQNKKHMGRGCIVC